MGWGQKKAARARPTWNQEDYHTAFAGKLKEQIEAGNAPWQKPWKPGESRLPKRLQLGDRLKEMGVEHLRAITPVELCGLHERTARNRQFAAPLTRRRSGPTTWTIEHGSSASPVPDGALPYPAVPWAVRSSASA